MALLMKSSIASFQVSFSLWVHFFAFSLKRATRRRWPLSIDGEESLGRTLFSGNYDSKKAKINIGAFMLKDASKGMEELKRRFYARSKKHT